MKIDPPRTLPTATLTPPPSTADLLNQRSAEIVQEREAEAREALTRFLAAGDDVPDVEYRHPDCPICMVELCSDGDALWCEHCPLTWDADGSRGAVDPDALAEMAPMELAP